MALNLAAIGAGLGQFAQQYRQQQESALRQQAAQLMLQKQRDEQAGLGAQWSTLLAGGIDRGQHPISPVGGAGDLNQLGNVMPGGSAPQAPVPPAPSLGAAAPAIGQGRQIASEPPIEREDTMPNAGMSVTGPPGHGIGTGIPEAPTGTEDTIEGRQTYAPPEEAAAPAAAPAPGDASAPASGGDQANMKPVMTAPNGQQVDLAAFMQRVSPTELAKRIEAAAPQATPAQKMSALNGLYKIYQSDNKTEQMLLAKVLGFNVGMARVEATVRGQNVRADTAAAGQAAAGDRLDKRLDTTRRGQDMASADRQARIEAAKARPDPRERRQALQAEQRAIQAQLNPPGIGAQQPSEQDRAALTRQLREVVNELRKISGIAPLLPQPSTPLPGGGATVPIQ